jgi:hypothetical protein
MAGLFLCLYASPPNYRIKFYANLKACSHRPATLGVKEPEPMNPTAKRLSNPQPSSSDSFFGMALASAFTGMVFGSGADLICDAGQTLSAVYEDRYDQKRTNGRGVYELGNKQSLADAFARMTEKTPAEMDRAAFRPSYAPAMGLTL